MKNILILFTFFSSFVFSQTEKKPAATITINYTLNYCGGARPNPEILENLNTPRPLANCKLKLVPLSKEIKGKTVYVKTNDKGQIAVKLQNYKYQVYIDKNTKNKAPLPFNKKCSKLSDNALGLLDATALQNEIEIKIPCDPCDPTIKKRQ